jgi:hypothetical protein
MDGIKQALTSKVKTSNRFEFLTPCSHSRARSDPLGKNNPGTLAGGAVSGLAVPLGLTDANA